MEKNKIYLSQEGYNKILKEIDELKEELKKNNSGRREAFDASAGDGWDSPEFEEIERNEIRIMGEIKRKYEQLEMVEIVEKDENSELIDIDDILKIDMIYSPDDIEELIVKLVGGSAELSMDYQEVSINSPLGKAIYKKKIGEKYSYMVNNNQFDVLVKEKINLTNINEHKKKLNK